MGKRLMIISILVAILLMFTWLLSAVAQDKQGDLTNITPTPIVFPPPNQSLYPELICPYFVEPQSGYSWQGVKVGETTQTELEAILRGFGNYKIIYRQENSLSNAIRYKWNEAKTESEKLQAPVTLDVCLQDGIVVVMEVNWSNQPFPFIDLISNIGVPDVVTWSWTDNRRVAFWFEKGIASEIFTQLGDDASFGLVIRMIYFPPQSSNGYQDRWPYNFTRMQPFNPVDPSIPNEQNPFDFKSMIATITAEPSRTPTPTFAALALTPTATATP